MTTEYNAETRKKISEYLSKYKRDRVTAQIKEPNFIKEMIGNNPTIKNLGGTLKDGNS